VAPREPAATLYCTSGCLPTPRIAPKLAYSERSDHTLPQGSRRAESRLRSSPVYEAQEGTFPSFVNGTVFDDGFLIW